jgi:hypothetical protein
MGQEMQILPEHMLSLPVFMEVHVLRAHVLKYIICGYYIYLGIFYYRDCRGPTVDVEPLYQNNMIKR